MKLFRGDVYRDDRLYVMRMAANFTKDGDGTVTVALAAEPNIEADKPVVLVTYRNLPTLPAVRVDDFSSFNAALDYIKRIEPTCPRISLQGHSPDPTPSWQEHLEWLHGQGLRSAAEGDTPLPDGTDASSNPREVLIIPPKEN
ncbi:MAG: hypothetical protein AB7P20_01460 [Rhizobiaceae bacterium]